MSSTPRHPPRTLGELRSPLLRRRLRVAGYAYLDEDHRHVDHLPARGWYLTVDDGDTPRYLRLTDEPEDGPHIRTDIGGGEP